MRSAGVSGTTTPLPPATVGPPVDGASSCPLGQGVLACIVAALVVVVVFLAVLAFSVLLLSCAQPRREPRRIHGHHRKRRRRRSHVTHRGRREEGICENALCGDRQQERATFSMMAEHGSSGWSSPDGSTSPYHPRYNSPATSMCCEDFRMPSCTCHGFSNRTPILHSTMCTQFHTATSCHLMSRLRHEATRIATPSGSDVSDTSRGSNRTVSADAQSDTHSLEWDNFQLPLLATRAWSSVSHLDITNGESLSVAGDSQQEHERQPKQPAQSQHWV